MFSSNSHQGVTCMLFPPKRVTLLEEPVDHGGDPINAYAKLGHAGQTVIILPRASLLSEPVDHRAHPIPAFAKFGYTGQV